MAAPLRPLFGATLSDAYLSSGPSAAERSAAWEQITGIPLGPVARTWNAPGAFGFQPAMQDYHAAGFRMCVTWRPGIPYNPAHAASMAATCQQLKDLGADVILNLWHEPVYSGVASAADFVAMWRAYAPVLREFYPIWPCYSGPDADPANGWWPGNDYVDGVAIDCYIGGTGSGDLTWTQNQVLNAQALADGAGVPYGVWEFGTGFDLGITPPVTAATQAYVTTFLTWLRDLFLARLAAGKPNGDIIWFNSGADVVSNRFGSALSQQGGFEGGPGLWATGSATLGHTASEAHSFGGAATITATASGNGNVTSSPGPAVSIVAHAEPCAAGDLIGGSAWFKPATAVRSVHVTISFYNAAGDQLPTVDGTPVTETPGGWVMASTSATAPATTAFTRLVPTVQGMRAGEVHYLDDPQIGVIRPANNICAPIQYPWDYRIPLLADMRQALENAYQPRPRPSGYLRR